MFSGFFLSAVMLSAPNQPPNSRCFSSWEITGDILADPRTRKETMITAIAVARDKAERTVGWVYNDCGGNRIAQVLPIISVADREVIRVRFAPRDRVSAFVPFPNTGNPWHDLTIHYCSPAEMIPAKYSRRHF